MRLVVAMVRQAPAVVGVLLFLLLAAVSVLGEAFPAFLDRQLG